MRQALAVMLLVWVWVEVRAMPLLPLGPADTPQYVVEEAISPGVTHYRVQRGRTGLNAASAPTGTPAESGPWVLHLVTIDPALSRGRLALLLPDVADAPRQPTSALQRAASSVVTINGGFFVERDADGFPGQAAGLSLSAGRVNSAPINGRPVLELRGGAISIWPQIDWTAELIWSNGQRMPVDGINRKVGLVRNCGRDIDDPPQHDHTCRYADDLVYFPPDSRYKLAEHDAARFAIGPAGLVRELRIDERPSAADALLVSSASSSRTSLMRQYVAELLRAAFSVHSRTVRTDDGASFWINGGPTLLLRGHAVREETREGWGLTAADGPQRARVLFDWVHRPHPRTAVGVRPDGVILLLVADGRRPGVSAGLTIEELRRVMAALGAEDALNLDGGGSTTMVIGGRVVNQPSDATGERRVGDAIGLVLE